jgi:hypothetical protein
LLQKNKTKSSVSKHKKSSDESAKALLGYLITMKVPVLSGGGGTFPI